MKVVYLSPSGAVGGAERVLLGIIKALKEIRPDAQVDVILLAAGPLAERARQLGASVTVLALPAALASLGDSHVPRGMGRLRKLLSLGARTAQGAAEALVFLRRFAHKLRRIRPDFIHSNGIKTHLLAALAAPKNTPVLWHVHDFIGSRPMACQLLRWAIRRATATLAVSQAVAADLRRVYPTAPVQVMGNTVDDQVFSPAPGCGVALDRLAGMAPLPGCLRAGLIATYARWKGQDVFLAAAAIFLKKNPGSNARFYIIGGPIYQTHDSQFQRSELMAQARCLRIDAHVGFIDFQADIVAVYRSLDVVVHASTAPEPFGLTIIEGMACGRAVIASQAGGAAEIFRNEHDALGVPPSDPRALAGAMARLLHDAALRRRLQINARQTVCERFDHDGLGARLVNVYRIGTRGLGASQPNKESEAARLPRLLAEHA